MKIYLRGYYGYKNFGDELLLLGLLPYLEKRYASSHICIQTPDASFLSSRIQTNSELLEQVGYTGKISFRKTIPRIPRKNCLLVLGGGEVLTDARKFPYNGWNYFLQHFLYFLFGQYVFVGGVGTIVRSSTKFLYRLLFRRAKDIIVRDTDSFRVASGYVKNVDLYHDFAYDVLSKMQVSRPLNTEDYAIININRHILTDSLISELNTFLADYTEFGQKLYFLPASVGFDDADSELFSLLLNSFPGIELFDWTEHTLQESINFMLGSKINIATRLHIALVLAYFQRPLKPLIYQEKVQRMLSDIDDLRSKFMNS